LLWNPAEAPRLTMTALNSLPWPDADDVVRVLLVEDDELQAQATRELLDESGGPCAFDTEVLTSLASAREALGRGRYEVVLLDLTLPDAEGLDALALVLEDAGDVPVIALVESDDLLLADACVREGAQDCLVKRELTRRTLERAIRYAIERLRKQMALKALSLTDELTGLANRRGFMLLGDQQLRLAQRTGRGLTLASIDLDGLKTINDTFGHAEGDIAIVQTADILRTSFRAADILARFGGDEFVALAIDTDQSSERVLLERLRSRLNDYNLVHCRGYRLAFSIGLAHFDPKHWTSLEALMEQADRHLYSQKHVSRAERSRVLSFPPQWTRLIGHTETRRLEIRD
jgi:diguanylate cyclase (GGDEF)-like protein